MTISLGSTLKRHLRNPRSLAAVALVVFFGLAIGRRWYIETYGLGAFREIAAPIGGALLLIFVFFGLRLLYFEWRHRND